jgi:hypothetical protein
VGLNLRSAVREAGALSFGDDSHAPENLIQRLSNNSWWTEAAALMSIPAGAAARGERNGWTGDDLFIGLGHRSCLWDRPFGDPSHREGHPGRFAWFLADPRIAQQRPGDRKGEQPNNIQRRFAIRFVHGIFPSMALGLLKKELAG